MTTLAEIKKHTPCLAGWRILNRALPHYLPDEPITIGFIAESNGALDAIWSIRAEPYSHGLKAKCVELANFISDHAEADEEQTFSEAVQRRCRYVQVRTGSLWLSNDLFQSASVTDTNSYKLKEKIIELFS